MDFEAKVFWPGVNQIESFTGTVAHGIYPGVFQLTIYPQAKPPEKTGTLRFTYGDHRWELPDCKVDSASYQFNASGEIIGLTIFDFRWRWDSGYISGVYNQRRADFSIVKKQNPANKDAVNDSERTPQELATLLLKAMGVEKFYVTDLPQALVRPEVNWDYSTPALMLDELCTSLACRIVPGDGNSVTIWQEGQGQELSAALPYEAYSIQIDLDNPPSKIICVTAPVQYRCDLTLSSVALEREGYWVPTENVNYYADAIKDIDECGDVADAFKRKLAVKSIYRHFRIDNNQSIGAQPIADREMILPLLSHRGEYSQPDEDGNKSLLPPITFGIAEETFGDNKEPEDNATVIFGSNVDDISDQIILDGHSINYEKGVVEFTDPLLRDSEGGLIELPATLKLRTAVNLRDAQHGQFIRYAKELVIDPTSPNKNAKVIRRDDIIPVVNRDGSRFNGQEVDDACDYYLAAEREKYRTQKPLTVHYIGWHPIRLDGAIQSMTFSMDSQGASMIVHRNHDPGSPQTVPYKVLQKDIKARRAIEETARAKAKAQADAARGVAVK
jgi:hypothetical protein